MVAKQLPVRPGRAALAKPIHCLTSHSIDRQPEITTIAERPDKQGVAKQVPGPLLYFNSYSSTKKERDGEKNSASIRTRSCAHITLSDG